jgi:VanZ family protein
MPFPSTGNDIELLTLVGADKWVHFVMYFTLFYTWTLENRRIKQKVGLFIMLGVGFGGLVEIIQFFGPYNRSAEWADFFADVSGILFGFFILSRRSLINSNN